MGALAWTRAGWRRFASVQAIRSSRGAALVEFAFVLPLLLTLIIGMGRFGITLNNFVMLTDAVRVGSRTFALSRGSATPYTTARARLAAGAPSLTPASITITLKVDGVTCATDAACQTALTTATDATVSATYPCGIVVMGIDFAPSCLLASQATGRVE